MPVVSVSMPAELIERLDTHAVEHDYTGRSEVVRESARTLLTEFDDTHLEGESLAGVVSVFYDFGTQHVERRVTELRHEHDTLIASNDHSHIDGAGYCDESSGSVGSASNSSIDSQQPAYCLDLFVLEGDLEAVSMFVGTLRAIEDIESIDYSLVPLDSIGHLQDD